MATGLKVRLVRVRSCRRRNGDLPTGPDQDQAADPGRGGPPCCWGGRGREGGRSVPGDDAHCPGDRTGGGPPQTVAGSHARPLQTHRKAVLGGMLAGALGQFMASPTDLVKVQMQMEGRRRLEGKPPRVRGVYHALVKTVSEGGVRGLWAGWVPNVQRAALVNMGDLTTYDTVKHFLLRNSSLQDNAACHGLASTCSGLVAATMGTPADVIKTRIMNQPRDMMGRGLMYRSSTDCLLQAVRGEGFLSLYKGFLPTWMRMVGPLPVCFLGTVGLLPVCFPGTVELLPVCVHKYKHNIS
ncbi:mitochondrial uncoupling protein 4 isoform X3 [Hypomesus transpacificus]|uniref:mitochondrial uncoupling protein 4 isoform X3 n=1 Tax=Hypomesus transpacificus TaxID=137520 RepID=UPI001F07E396|nr:mitochondrial uncoupling protein 4 isoform X3 [Hypomesus transpacificus]